MYVLPPCTRLTQSRLCRCPAYLHRSLTITLFLLVSPLFPFPTPVSSRVQDDEDDEDGSDAESVGIREITVRDSDPGAGEEESDVGDDDASEEGVVMECDNGAEAGEVPSGGG